MNRTKLRGIVNKHASQGGRFTVLSLDGVFVYNGNYALSIDARSMDLIGTYALPGIERIAIDAISKVSVDWHGNVEITVDTLRVLPDTARSR